MGSCQLHQPMRIVTSFLRYDHVSNYCRLSPREEASRSPFQRFTLNRDGQIIRLEKERKDCLVKGQLDCVWRSAGGGGKEVRAWLVSWNKSQYHCNLSEKLHRCFIRSIDFLPRKRFWIISHTERVCPIPGLGQFFFPKLLQWTSYYIDIYYDDCNLIM